MSTASLAAVFAASAIVPVASAEAAQALDIEKVVFTQDGNLVTLTYEDYLEALEAGVLKSELTHVQATDGKVYSYENYVEALEVSKNDPAAALGLLNKSGDEIKNPKLSEGQVDKDGNVVADETPEEKVNETFFYNLAA